jgi:hypothetical protein
MKRVYDPGRFDQGKYEGELLPPKLARETRLERMIKLRAMFPLFLVLALSEEGPFTYYPPGMWT